MPDGASSNPDQLHSSGNQWNGSTITRYLGVTLDKALTWSPHIDQVRKKTAQRMGMLGPLLKRKSDLSVRNGVLLYKQFISPMTDYACPRLEVRCPLPCPEATSVKIQVSSPCYWCPLVRK